MGVVDKQTEHFKAIAKSTGKPCKRVAVKDGFCRYHLPRELRVDEEPGRADKNQNINPSLGEAFLNQQHTTRIKTVSSGLLLSVPVVRRKNKC